ncbi:hypothetical protein DFH27DRAFT_545037 [Peziza echinospora]|nr:hypothetical protein DFH27DRAFT_545037 [Peziza echinospora]
MGSLSLTFKFLLLSLLSTTVLAHMHLISPRPLGFDARNPTEYDWWVGRLGGARTQNPYPCRGKVALMDTEESAATYNAGQSYEFKLGGTSPHWGGSCQLSLSYDRGVTFRVLKSWSGACPNRQNTPGADNGQNFKFTVHADAPSGTALLGWSWINREREYYHNCAKVTVVGGGKQSLDALPLAMIAEVNNGCQTPLSSAEVLFERPGADHVINKKDYPLLPPTGGEKCYSNPPGMAQPKGGAVAAAAQVVAPKQQRRRSLRRRSRSSKRSTKA